MSAEKEKQELQYVAKSNDLIRYGRLNLTVHEQKLINYVIMLVKPTDKDFKRYKINVRDFCDLCGINESKAYTEFKNMIIDLDSKTRWIETPDYGFDFRWFTESYYLKKEGAISVMLHSALRPYILELKQNYTQYEIYNIMALNGKYSIRLFELIKSYAYQKEVVIGLKELKQGIDADAASYNRFNNFRQWVLDKSIDEINECTELQVKYTPVLTGKTITAIKFMIRQKRREELYNSYLKAKEKIDERNGQIKGQTSLFDLSEDDFGNTKVATK
jgi:plasmid replication initiation protein